MSVQDYLTYLSHNWSMVSLSVADPGFSPGGVRKLPKVLLFFNFFAKNCMKMKEFGPRGRAALAPPWIRQCRLSKIRKHKNKAWKLTYQSGDIFVWNGFNSNLPVFNSQINTRCRHIMIICPYAIITCSVRYSNKPFGITTKFRH